MFILQTVIEFGIAALLIVGLFKEEKVVAFEDRIVATVKRKLRNRKGADTYHSSKSFNRKNCA